MSWAEWRKEQVRHNVEVCELRAEIERLRQQLWLAREDMAHLVQQIDAVLGQETP